MGWGRALFLGDIGNQLDIQDRAAEIGALRRELTRKADTDERQSEAIEQLLKENVELKLYLGALIRLLTRKNVLTRAELERLVQLIDPAEGLADASDVEIDLRDTPAGRGQETPDT